MKTTHFFVTASTDKLAKDRAIGVISDANLDVLDYDVLSATDIGSGEYEVAVRGSASAIRKLRKAIANGDAQ